MTAHIIIYIYIHILYIYIYICKFIYIDMNICIHIFECIYSYFQASGDESEDSIDYFNMTAHIIIYIYYIYIYPYVNLLT
jgi:hypothetical protein